MSHLARTGHSTKKAQDLVTQQNVLCCFIGLTFMLYLKLCFVQFFNYKSDLLFDHSVFKKYLCSLLYHCWDRARYLWKIAVL